VGGKLKTNKKKKQTATGHRATWQEILTDPLLLPREAEAASPVKGRVGKVNEERHIVGSEAGRLKWTNFHPLNQTLLNGEPMPHVLIGQNRSCQVAHYLMHVDQNAPGFLRVEGHWLYVPINLAPLLHPVGADLFRSTDKTTFERSGPLHVGSHENKGSVDVSRVEGRVGCA
jgi:hypothetical protein